MKKYMYLILLFSWMLVIFSFSAKNKPESGQMSHRVSMRIGYMMIPGFENWTWEEQIKFAERIEYPVRKGAHATEYAILGIISFLTLLEWKDIFGKFLYNKNKEHIEWKKLAYLSWIIATIYACSDEFHQIFVPGRSGQIKDVCIDSAGAIVGIIGVSIFLKILWIAQGKSKAK